MLLSDKSYSHFCNYRSERCRRKWLVLLIFKYRLLYAYISVILLLILKKKGKKLFLQLGNKNLQRLQILHVLLRIEKAAHAY